jgi:hypothetical protein
MARRRALPTEPEVLGEVTAPSGIVVLVDMGLLGMWCHGTPPRLPEWEADPQTVAAANGGADFRIVGADAAAAGRAFDRQLNPRYLFDIPAHGVGPIQEQFAAFVRERGFDARLVQLKKRVPHRRRIDLALAGGERSGEVFFFGAWGRVVGGVPKRKRLRVLGERLPRRHRYEGRWRSVWLECRPGVAVARSEPAHDVAVDRARLIFADADALGAWQHHRSLDGLADFVFWGRDAVQAAAEVGAPALPEGNFGWLDLPVGEAIERGREVEELQDQREWGMATDFRPHSHHYQVMRQVDGGATESGTVRVGAALVCGFMTSWGDGIYPVFLDLDEGDQLVRIRVELGNEATIRRMEAVEERYSGIFARVCLVSNRVLSGEARVGRLFREEPVNDNDSGWRIFEAGVTEEQMNAAEGTSVVPIRDVLSAQRDEALEAVLRGPVGSDLERAQGEGPFVPAVGWEPNESV